MHETVYSKACQKAEDILFMTKFMRFAYNQACAENEIPMGNEEKTGGLLLFRHIENELELLIEEIQK